jgi:hypothetical protein
MFNVMEDAMRLELIDFSTADLLAASGYTKPLFDAHVRQRILQFEQPGTGARRTYRLLDVYFARLLAGIARHGIGPAMASKALCQLIYTPGFSHHGIGPESYATWFPELSDRTNSHFLMLHKSLSIDTYLARFVAADTVLAELAALAQRPNDDLLPTAVTLINVTAELTAADEILRARRSLAGGE